MSETKQSNPKEAFGDAKMPLDLLPDTATAQFNLAFLEGALKYGGYNYRVVGVKASTYVRAARRHLAKWWNGQDADPKTMISELASVGACVAILLDAAACGKLTDDRPPRADMEKLLDDCAKTAAHLKQLFKDHNPPQYTEREHGVQYIDGVPVGVGTTYVVVPDSELYKAPPCLSPGCDQLRVEGAFYCDTHYVEASRAKADCELYEEPPCIATHCDEPRKFGSRYCVAHQLAPSTRT